MHDIFGGTGFIGSRYHAMYGGNVIPRDNVSPIKNDVVYLISTTHNYNVFSDIHLDVNTNLNHLLEVLEKNKEALKGKVFNFISSWFVYGEGSILSTEESDCKPKGFYSITKKCAEDLLISFCETFGIDYRIFRLCNVYGPNDNFSKQKNALQYLIDKLKKHEQICLYHGGNFYRNYMHVDDVCSAISFLAETAPKNQIYNIASDENILFRDIIDFVIKETGSRSPIEIIEPPPFHKIVQVKDIWLCNKRLKSLGFSPKYKTTLDGIRSIL